MGKVDPGGHLAIKS